MAEYIYLLKDINRCPSCEKARPTLNQGTAELCKVNRTLI